MQNQYRSEEFKPFGYMKLLRVKQSIRSFFHHSTLQNRHHHHQVTLTVWISPTFSPLICPYPLLQVGLPNVSLCLHKTDLNKFLLVDKHWHKLKKVYLYQTASKILYLNLTLFPDEVHQISEYLVQQSENKIKRFHIENRNENLSILLKIE